MSIANFAFRSLKMAYEESPQVAFAAGLSACASYGFGSRYVVLPKPGVMLQFTAAAYMSHVIWKAFQEEVTSSKTSYGSQLNEDDFEFEPFSATPQTEKPIPKSQQERKAKPADRMDTLRKITAVSLGAYALNFKFNPESTFVSFVKLSVSAALSIVAAKLAYAFTE